MKSICLSLSVIVFFILILGFNYSPNKNEEEVILKWKISEKDSLFYETTMHEIGNYSFDFKIKSQFLKLFEEENLDAQYFFRSLDEYESESDYKSILKMSERFESKIDISIWDKIRNSLIINGMINESGEIESFWLANTQKNLLSIFYQLPNIPVKKGDRFNLREFRGISISESFVCENAEKRSDIIISDVYKEKRKGETIIKVNYDIFEYVSGLKFNTTLKTEGVKKMKEMKFIYKAQGLFSLEKGRWISYIGFLHTYNNEYGGSSQNKIFKLSKK